MAHEFINDDRGYGCKTCGSRYHCGQCGEGSGMMGHFTRDGDGEFFWCQDPDRLERLNRGRKSK